MKRVLSVILASAIVITLSAACGSKEEKKENSEVNENYHTLYFKDSSKSDEVVATFFNSASGKREDGTMDKCSEDNNSYTFSCKGDTSVYNMAYISYNGVYSEKFAFNKCVSGWYNSDHGFLPYTEGKEPNYNNKYDEVTLTFKGYDKHIHIWKPDDYDASGEKYSTVYLLDGHGMFFLDFPGETLLDSEHADVQVQSMIAATGKKAIVVAIDTYGNEKEFGREDELVPDLGKTTDEKHLEWTQKCGGEFSDFVGRTLIPYVQKHYNVYTDALHTSIAGKSLGGLEAFYIAMENPDKIGTAGALSPSFWVFADEQWNDYLSKKAFDKKSPFLYFYTGNDEDDTGKETKEMVERLKKMNYPDDKYVLHYNENGGHAVPYWRNIFPEFLNAMVFQEVAPLKTK